MNCREFQIEVEESETGRELSAGAAAHCGVCGSCRSFFMERRALREILGKVPPVSAPSDFDFRLRARLATTGETRRNLSGRFNFSPGNLAITFAASFALLFAVTIAVQQFRSTGTQRATASGKMQVGAEATSATGASTSSLTEVQNQANSIVSNPAESSAVGERLSGANARNEAKRRVEERLRGMTASDSQRQRIVSHDFVDTIASAPVAQLDPEVHVQFRSPLAPSRLFVNEHDGTRRDVSLKPVTFGSQNILPLRRASDTSTTGIW
ncbi:MAG TPA: hypothetical protein VK619_17460 [Pyrinomonadaceae bacterium]|nr:hypothetical protein [Pyrinomonadaceae bacterium]